MKSMHLGLAAIAATCAAIALAQAPAQKPAAPEGDVPVKGLADDPYGEANRAKGGQAAPKAKGYSPYAGRKYPTRPLFGDTHLHTTNSGDAFAGGTRLDPEQAYRFARGRGGRLVDRRAGEALRVRSTSSSSPTTPKGSG